MSERVAPKTLCVHHDLRKQTNFCAHFITFSNRSRDGEKLEYNCYSVKYMRIEVIVTHLWMPMAWLNQVRIGWCWKICHYCQHTPSNTEADWTLELRSYTHLSLALFLSLSRSLSLSLSLCVTVCERVSVSTLERRSELELLISYMPHLGSL